MKTFFELRENVKTADKKPEAFTKPDGKKGVRMVPVDREVVKQEKNLEWLKAALEAQARKTKPCDEDVEETAEAKEVDEVLDRPGALDSYRKKADASGNKARNSATRKILRGPDKDGKRADHSDELNTMRKRNKGQDMADRAANRHFRKSIGLGYNSKKESVELDENKFASKAADRHKENMKQARADMKSANNRDAMVKAMNRYQSAKKAHDRATRASFDEAKVDEISNAKMGQYVRKAADDAARKASKGDVVGARQRVKGVNKAMDKMDKNRLYGKQ